MTNWQNWSLEELPLDLIGSCWGRRAICWGRTAFGWHIADMSPGGKRPGGRTELAKLHTAFKIKKHIKTNQQKTV